MKTNKKNDAVWLLEISKKIMGGVDTKANPVLTLHEQTLSFFTMRQGQSKSDEDYLQRFNAWDKSLELAGGEQFL